jgi:hypothetical protein
VRSWLTLCAFLSLCSLAGAQEQERKLVDRLLRPDASLQNNAQNKKWSGGKVAIDKKANVSTFYVEQKSRTKKFERVRGVSASSFNASQSYRVGEAPGASSKQVSVNADRASATTKTVGARPVHDSNKETNTQEFSGNRPFLARGKSQKSLERQNESLTIEQVRELLNKNK